MKTGTGIGVTGFWLACLAGCGGACGGGAQPADTDSPDAGNPADQCDAAPDDGGLDADVRDAAEDVEDANPFLFDVCPGPSVFENREGCAHPPVVADCDAGWCRIPAGCFDLGSPYTEPIRGAYSETPTQVTLTHSFEIMQYEVTHADWARSGFPDPSELGPGGSGACPEDDCPVENVTWFEAAAFANRMSELHDPPLPACHVLTDCEGEVGRGMVCDGFGVSAATIYDCAGYRLPTFAEHEYATRAGTTTTYYSGPILMRTSPLECVGGDPCLEPIAWFCWNSEGRTHRVGTREPNAWGLYDMLGNVSEWVNDEFSGLGYGGEPIVDPTGPDTHGIRRCTKGGFYSANRYLTRPAAGYEGPRMAHASVAGLRLVRTLP